MGVQSRLARRADGMVGATRPAKVSWRRLLRVEESRRVLSLLVTAARALSAVVGIAVPIVLVRVFDQTVFGYYKELFLIAGTAAPLLTLGLPASLYYLVPRRPEEGQRFLVQSVLLLGALGLAGAATLALAGPGIQRFFHAPLAAYMPWMALFTALSVPVSLLPVAPMVDRRAWLVALLLAGFDTLRAAALITAALWARDLSVLLGVACGVMAVQAGALVGYVVWRGGWERASPPRAARLREQLAYALPFAAAAFVGLCRDKLHAYYVGGTVSAADFAVYAVGVLQLPLIGHLTQSVGEVVVLENAGLFAAGRRDHARTTYQRAAVGLAVILFPVFAVAEVFASELVTVLYGQSYAGAVPVLRTYLLIVPLEILLASPLLRATADLRVMLGADLASLAVAIATLVPLVSAFGPAGAVGGLVAGFATFTLVASRRNAGRLGLGLAAFAPWRHLAALLGAAAACAVAARLLVQAAPPLWRLGLGLVLAAALYGALLWRTILLPGEDRDWVRKLLRRLAGGGGGMR